MSHWNRKQKTSQTLTLSSRITLSLVQVRGDGPPSPWWAQLDGVGPDPETRQPPKAELSAALSDEGARAEALVWAFPMVRAYAKEQADALQIVLDHMEGSNS